MTTLSLAAAGTPHARDLLERQIAVSNHEIDRLVYALYDLTAEEITLVEAGGKKPADQCAL